MTACLAALKRLLSSLKYVGSLRIASSAILSASAVAPAKKAPPARSLAKRVSSNARPCVLMLLRANARPNGPNSKVSAAPP